jgi:hypothetical protein
MRNWLLPPKIRRQSQSNKRRLKPPGSGREAGGPSPHICRRDGNASGANGPGTKTDFCPLFFTTLTTESNAKTTLSRPFPQANERLSRSVRYLPISRMQTESKEDDRSRLRFGGDWERPCEAKGGHQCSRTEKTSRRDRAHRHGGRRVHPQWHDSKQDPGMRSFISQASLKECSTGKITVSETESARRRIARRVPMIVKRETHLVRSQFNGNRIAALDGIGRFVDPHTLEIISP